MTWPLFKRWPCGYEHGLCSHVECAEYLEPWEREIPPGDVEYCASGGHAYYGDDGDMGRCYCGEKLYIKGGPTSDPARCTTPRPKDLPHV